MAKILMVTKDIAEFNNFHPIADKLSTREHRVAVIPEGLSMQKWNEKKSLPNGFAPFIWGEPAEVMRDANTLMRHDIPPETILRLIEPDLVITGLASPINLGEQFGRAANALDIPLGYIEDTWGVHTRSKAKPTFVCTVDEYGASLARNHYENDFGGKCVAIFITGAPADDALLNVKPHPEVEAVVQKTPYAVLVAGQDHATTPMLQGLIHALEAIGNYTLIPRFHPKWLAVTQKTIAKETDPEKKRAAEGIFAACNQWREMLATVKNGKVWWAPAEITTHQIMKSVPYVVSIYSNVLREAGILGALPVSWTSDIGRDMMRQHMGGLKQYPLVESGLVMEVETPTDWWRRVPQSVDRVHISKLFNADGKNTERVVKVMERYYI